MKKRTKILFGVAILIAIVSMNIRHAWMNYGIAENKILAGVAADSGNVAPTPCDTKFTYQIVRPDRIEYTETVYTNCTIRTEHTFFQIAVNGKKIPVAKVTNDLASGEITVKYYGNVCNYDNLPSDADYIKKDLSSEKAWCGGDYTKGHCCYPHNAETNCSVLVKNLRTT